MKNKTKVKVLKVLKVLKGIRGTLEDDNFIKFEDAMNFKRIIKEFDKYIYSKEIYNELISMKTTQYSAVDIIRCVWNDIKGGF